MKFRFYLGCFFILIQIGLIFYARFVPERFFCWAPFDIQTQYKVTAIINNNKIDSSELEMRYKYWMEGWEQRSIYNVFSIIKQYENTYGINDKVKINATYSINGKSEQSWEYNNE